MLERNYDIFHRFTGRSSLRTYLTVVVTRMLLDWLNATYGKWRPSAVAVRLGADAIKLDRLIWRDGYTIDEAVSIVAGGPTSWTRANCAPWPSACPHRLPRRRVPEMVLDQHQVMDFEDPVEVAERRRARLVAATALQDRAGRPVTRGSQPTGDALPAAVAGAGDRRDAPGGTEATVSGASSSCCAG